MEYKDKMFLIDELKGQEFTDCKFVKCVFTERISALPHLKNASFTPVISLLPYLT